jgi:uncharacterized protein (DUF427 family)
VWSYPVPLDETDDLSAYVAFYWNKIDNWFEDDEEVFDGHLQDRLETN